MDESWSIEHWQEKLDTTREEYEQVMADWKKESWRTIPFCIFLLLVSIFVTPWMLIMAIPAILLTVVSQYFWHALAKSYSRLIDLREEMVLELKRHEGIIRTYDEAAEELLRAADE